MRPNSLPLTARVDVHILTSFHGLASFRPSQHTRVYGIAKGTDGKEAGAMTVTIGINGFGRIGRCTLAHITEAARNDVQVVKINATGPIATNAHLLKYDSVHGRFGSPITVSGNTMDLGPRPD